MHERYRGRSKPSLRIEVEEDSDDPQSKYNDRRAQQALDQAYKAQISEDLGKLLTTQRNLHTKGAGQPSYLSLNTQNYNLSTDSNIPIAQTMQSLKDALARHEQQSRREQNQYRHDNRIEGTGDDGEDWETEMGTENLKKMTFGYVRRPEERQEFSSQSNNKFGATPNISQSNIRYKIEALDDECIKRIVTENQRKDTYAAEILDGFYRRWMRRVFRNFLVNLQKTVIARSSPNQRLPYHRVESYCEYPRPFQDSKKTFAERSAQNLYSLRRSAVYSSGSEKRSITRAKILNDIVEKLRRSQAGRSNVTFVTDREVYEQRKQAVHIESRLRKIESMLAQIRKTNKECTYPQNITHTQYPANSFNQLSDDVVSSFSRAPLQPSLITQHKRVDNLASSRQFQPSHLSGLFEPKQISSKALYFNEYNPKHQFLPPYYSQQTTVPTVHEIPSAHQRNMKSASPQTSSWADQQRPYLQHQALHQTQYSVLQLTGAQQLMSSGLFIPIMSLAPPAPLAVPPSSSYLESKSMQYPQNLGRTAQDRQNIHLPVHTRPIVSTHEQPIAGGSYQPKFL